MPVLTYLHFTVRLGQALISYTFLSAYWDYNTLHTFHTPSTGARNLYNSKSNPIHKMESE